jgi:RNA polymerase sigma factor (sigma-70 family)
VCPRELGVSCEDIEQEAWVAVWHALRGEREIAFPASYVYKAGVSAASRAVRRARSRREESLQEEDAAGSPVHPLPAADTESPHEAAARSECRQKIAAALTQLPENRRAAVGLHLRGLTTSEIGNLLQWSEPKARNLVHRGLKDLRAVLRSMGIEDGS